MHEFDSVKTICSNTSLQIKLLKKKGHGFNVELVVFDEKDITLLVLVINNNFLRFRIEIVKF